MTIRIAIAGFGKIARDEHLPAIRAHGGYELAAIVSHGSAADIGCPKFDTIAEMMTALPSRVDAIAICTPPKPRFALASQAIAAGLSVLLEKPPAATLGEMDQLVALAKKHGSLIYTAWHSQHAAGVAPAKAVLAGAPVKRISLVWHEDVRKFHPDQQWIWEPGGFGVFDPGINGLSILTRILSVPLSVRSAELLFPANRHAPIATRLKFDGDDRVADMDWRGMGKEQWSISIELESGEQVELVEGGAKLLIDGTPQLLPVEGEYSSIYRDFSDHVNAGKSFIDAEPLRIVADAFLIGKRKLVGDFV
ncbi:Gfo/Idh/MocA family protein [Sphingorhabdus contaminans]|uniref:Gfo/Idh/MocA family protein n=1 Tax=Sphingorhabdus contaminans TaxID=1343899 RepID=UPI001FE817B1|nr:Gfo/Idh/MocA family oxidoreductase [Sphingorhabdus contaminans]